MTRFLLAVPLLLAAGCATRPTAIVCPPQFGEQVYVAVGGSPVWIVIVGEDYIAARTTSIAAGGGAEPAYRDYRFPRTLPRTVGEVRTWQTSEGGQTLVMEARRQPCRRGARFVFEDSVRVVLNGQTFEGCGGRPVREEAQG